VPDTVEAGELAIFEPSNNAINIYAKTDADFALGSAAAHTHDLVLGKYSVHTSAATLRAGEQRIDEIEQRRKLIKSLQGGTDGAEVCIMVSNRIGPPQRHEFSIGNSTAIPEDFSLMTWFTWSLLSAVFAAVTAILAKIGVSGIDANQATAVRTSVVVVFAWLLVFITRQQSPFQVFPGRTWLFLFLSGIATGLSWLCYFHALQVGPASRVAPIDKLSVPIVILLAALFLGERLTWSTAAGGMLILAGAITIALG